MPKGDKLTPKQEMFCRLYVSREFFGNGVESYCEAYNLDITDRKDYNNAGQGATRLLKNAKILTYINEHLDENGLNDGFVDKQLLFTITQSADMSSKMKAISEYNKLRSRIADKLNIETKDTSHTTKWGE